MQFHAWNIKNNATRLGAIFNIADYPIAVEMKDLYQACLDKILQDDDLKFHLLMRPTEFGGHYLLAAGDDPSLDHAIERASGSKVKENDCVVVLCRGILTQRRTPVEMMKLVISDITNFITDNYSIAEPAAGSVGSVLSWIAVTNILTTMVAREETELIGSTAEEMERIGAEMLGVETIPHIGLVGQKTTRHPEMMKRLCAEIAATNSGYLSLPLKIMDIVDSGRSILSSIIDERQS